jgi:hypothetical protein
MQMKSNISRIMPVIAILIAFIFMAKCSGSNIEQRVRYLGNYDDCYYDNPEYIDEIYKDGKDENDAARSICDRIFNRNT